MAGGGGSGGGPVDPTSSLRTLQETPSWALATVCFVFIFLGLLIEYLIHLICHWLKKHRKNALFEAVEKMKSVLMLLGFMSLILAVTQRSISNICVSDKAANYMLPCRKTAYTKTAKTLQHFWTAFQNNEHGAEHGSERMLAPSDASSSSDHCGSKRMYSFISVKGLNELSIFIFVLAVMQIVYGVATMALSRAQMRRWKTWEKETQTVEYMAANDPERFRFTRETTFGRRHMSDFTQTQAQLWIKCFFRQFFHSVAKVDYFTLRHGFISAHLSTTNNTFNFRKYIQRSLEEDFKVVVGISPFMWFTVVIFLLVDVHGWNVYLWLSFLPLILVLVIGTKLEVIVAKMALQLQNHNSVIRGTPVVELNDRLFWFGQPRFVLTLLHFTLFLNAFEFAFFIWVTLQFGIKSCYHERLEVIVVRVVLAVMVQVLCSHITLPLYALVTQMGTKFNSPVFEQQTVHAIKEWHADVRKKRREQTNSSKSPNHYANNAGDYSSTVRSIGSTNSTPDASTSNNRNPTLSKFSSRAGEEIIEEQPNLQEKEDHIVEVSVISQGDRNGDDLEIQVTEFRNTSPLRSSFFGM